MKHYKHFRLFILTLMLLTITFPYIGTAENEGVIVLLRIEEEPVATRSLNQSTSESDLDTCLDELGASAPKRFFSDKSLEKISPSAGPQPLASVDAGSVDRYQKKQEAVDRLGRWRQVELPAGTDAEVASKELEKVKGVEVAEPVREWDLMDEIPHVIEDLPDATTDPEYYRQGHHTQAQANNVNAWNYLNTHGVYPGGRDDVVVAVIDTGVDAGHPELAGNMWINPGEIPDNGQDDDGNGFIDDVHGCNVVGEPSHHSGDSGDYHGHGTHVAGIIGAQAYNSQGGCGVAFNTSVMAVRAAQSSGVLTTADIADGIVYVTEQGADVINMSFGGYQRSQIVADALAVALNQAVLVAAAGNDHLDSRRYPCYPAALHYVIGTMASTPSGGLAWFSNYGPHYEIKAPGTSIYSTLPDGQYAAWSGTSMAAPVVSGAAALIRSYFWQREVYSSRFLMGSIVYGGVLDTYQALTEPPTPGVSLHGEWLFDDTGIDSANLENGRIDSGERVHIGIEAINRAGMASNVVVTLRARAPGAVVNDPYVDIPNDTVSFGQIGPFNVKDNGFIYSAEGEITGVESPFVVEISEDCPNDHVIPFEITFTFYDGWNEENTGEMQHIDRFEMSVQRGRDVPNVIEAGTTNTLTHSDLWIVGEPVLVEDGALLRITEGTRVQWGKVSADPYNPGPQSGNIVVRGRMEVEGTATNPVSLFPSYLVSGQRTDIKVEDNGQCDMAYVRIQNPDLENIRSVRHGDLHWNMYSSDIDIEWAENTRFGKFRGGGSLHVGRADTCLFDAGWLDPNGYVRNGCVFLQDNENQNRYDLAVPLSFRDPLTNDKGDLEFWSTPLTTNGCTYVLLPMEHVSLRVAEAIASYYGGHVASVRDGTDFEVMKAYAKNNANYRSYGSGNSDWVYVGLSNWENPTEFTWLDGSPTNFTNWADGHPASLNLGRHQLVQFLQKTHNGDTCFYEWKTGYQTDSYRTGHGGVDSWKSFLLRLPGDWTLENLNAPVNNGDLLEHVRQNIHPLWRNNALLSAYWAPNIDHWMRLRGTANRSDGYCVMPDNYWGTTNTTLIDHMIRDYYDDFTSARIVYGDTPKGCHTSTWPYVESVLINGTPAITVPKLGAGETAFEITFNRDMDQSVVPFVTFGPEQPFTDFEIEPVNTGSNGWQNARTWKGSFYIVPVTGEGYHQMRISGAVAADDPWLESGYDVGRFRFKVETMGVAAMTLQASGQEGAIKLSWQQDDYDLIAGYNIYRSDSVDGTFEKLNDNIIPVEQLSYTDTDVTPAEPMYYKFTVVLTDFSESDFSNTAGAAALDTIAPVIVHTPPTSTAPGVGFSVKAQVTDNIAVSQSLLHYRAKGGTESYKQISMQNVQDDQWSCTMPGANVQPPGIEYYLTASDGISTTYKGTPATPYLVDVDDQPAVTAVSPNSGTSSGGTQVTVSGMRFEPGVSVLFGGMPAANVEFMTSTQLRCYTPAHNPMTVDVEVVNTNGTTATKLHGFQFVTEGVVFSLPTTDGDYGTLVEIPITVANVEGLLGADLTLQFDPAVLSPVDASPGPLASGWTSATNFATSGEAILSMANSMAVSGNGVLARVQFEVVGEPLAQSSLSISSASLNDGSQTWQAEDGLFSVSGLFNISGNTEYFTGGAIPGADLYLTGSGEQIVSSDETGAYQLSDVPTGSYTLYAGKTNTSEEVSACEDAISAYDATLALQAAVGLNTLSDAETMAVDVNCNGEVTSMDASLILQYAVGLIDLPFPGSDHEWAFLPASISYPLLDSDKDGQDFTAVLLGDISGTWESPAISTAASLNNLPPSSETEKSISIDLNLTPMLDGEHTIIRVISHADDPLDALGTDIIMYYDSESVQPVEVYSDFSMAVNTNVAGKIRMGIVNPTETPSNAVIASIKVRGEIPPDFTMGDITVNEGQVQSTIADCANAFDSDGDGLLDIDETEIFQTDPGLRDTTGDGISDGDRVLVGFNPTNSAGKFHCWLDFNEINMHLHWQSAPGRIYTVYRINLQTGVASPVANLTGSGDVQSYMMKRGKNPHGFFYIEVQYPDELK